VMLPVGEVLVYFAELTCGLGFFGALVGFW